MKSRLLVLGIVVALASGVGAYAHHSFAGTYREGDLMAIEGTVVEFMVRNPHSFVSVEVTDENGEVTRWGGEWGGVSQLANDGVDRFTLRYGDNVVIEGAPPRDASEHKILVRRVTRPATPDKEEFVWQGRVN